MNYNGDTIKDWAGDSQWRRWRADLARFRKHGYSGWFSETFWMITIYRMQKWTQRSKLGPLLLPLKIWLAIQRKVLTFFTHINLHPSAEIGPGLLLPHVGLIQIGPKSRIGADCAIHHLVTIGAGAKPGVPTLGDHVQVACHVCILGPVTVGDRAKIGAGAVVISDIPADATAVGVPAKALQKKLSTNEHELARMDEKTPVPGNANPPL